MNASTYEIATSIIVVTLLFLLLAGFIIEFFIIFQKRRKEYLVEKLNLQNTFQQELLKTKLEIQEQTFQNISQEIHDNIGQTLSFIKLNINTVSYDISDPDKEKLNESKNLLTKVIQDLRDLSKTLNTDFIKEIGLVKAIEQQLQILQKSGVYKTQLMVTGEAFELSLQLKLVVFRVVQEALNNAVKHSDASSLNVSINYQSEKLVITVNDNGKGFDIKELESNKGIGFRNMVNRMQLIKGSVKVNSTSGKGTSVIIQLLK